jgi:hypothetical protein
MTYLESILALATERWRRNPSLYDIREELDIVCERGA